MKDIVIKHNKTAGISEQEYINEYMKKVDDIVSHRIKNVAYQLNIIKGGSMNNPANYIREYFVHENRIVYDRYGNTGELESILSDEYKELYLIDPTIDSWCKQYFMVMNPYLLKDDSYIFFLNGEKLYYNKNIDNSVYEYLWSNTREKGLCRDLIVDTNNPKVDVKLNKSLTKCNFEFSNTTPFLISEKNIKKVKDIDWDKISNSNKTEQENHPRPKNDGKDIPYTNFITSDFPALELKDGETVDNTVTDITLLFTQIEFLNGIEKSSEHNMVLYIGDSCQQHLYILSRMFNKILFIVYSPRDYCFIPTPNIVIKRRAFTEKDKGIFKNMHILLISSEINQQPLKNYNYVKDIHPWQSIISYDNDTMSKTFKSKDKFLKIFTPENSSSTFLSINKQDIKDNIITDSDDKKLYMMQLNYFNKIYRKFKFYDYDPIFGKNYDSLKLFAILVNYWKNDDRMNNASLKSFYKIITATIYEMEDFFKSKFISLQLRI